MLSAMTASFVLSGVMGSSTVTADDPAASRTDPRLAGIWVIESGVNNGVKIPKEELDGARTIVRENAITSFDRDEKVTYRCVYKFNLDHDPNSIDMISTMPTSQDAEAPGIYRVDKDSWTLCYSYAGGERPTAFESKPGSKTMLLKMKRLDKKAETQQDQ
jgi:uncharacterized protein (TIGR03067 family)